MKFLEKIWLNTVLYYFYFRYMRDLVLTKSIACFHPRWGFICHAMFFVIRIRIFVGVVRGREGIGSLLITQQITFPAYIKFPKNLVLKTL